MNTLMCGVAAGLFSADKVLAWLSPAGVAELRFRGLSVRW